ncbi:hypothetical protein EUTSA_v10004939mg [Eutrema salsugineum]|uniref:Pectinesterase inhibitor domain-containing protein n=1 Tax=Eutrema salsugineum TaxID=72664 RepID=V4L0C0_EUTSA|nr:pectinesterase inhibitor 7 [Eutrema salsugineum]ESQ33158.1 hypothetical protein EUTSA_v10004939mg [Eutrema salsugineum]
MVSQSHTSMILLFTIFLFISSSVSALHVPPQLNATTNDLDFIKTSCNATTYPDVCFKSLAGYASAVKDSPARLARLAVGVSLSQAKSTVAFLSNLSRTASQVRDCVSSVEDAIDSMRDSLQQLRDMKRGKSGETFRFQLSNVQTWMSAALTDEEDCTDGFEEVYHEEEDVIKTTVCDRVQELKRFTSNALALVNTYANNGSP